MMRFAKSFILSLVLLAGVAPASAQDDSTAIVASWNLGGFNPIPNSKLENIAKALADIDAEVVALSEVNNKDVPEKLVNLLDQLGCSYRKAFIDQPQASQDLAVLFKEGVSVNNKRTIDGTDLGKRGWREAFVVDVKIGKFDFILINLHLKAGRSSTARNGRSDQCELIAEFIEEATDGAEKDVMVVGDYNMIPGRDSANFRKMNPDGFLRFISSEDFLDESSHIHRDGSFGNLLDGYAVSATNTTEYVEGTLRILPLYKRFEADEDLDDDERLTFQLREFHSKLSDHLPIVARFRILEDDD